MSDDRQECLRILNEAIVFEEEGQNFFLEREKNAPTKLERSIFHSLAVDEADHKAYLVEMRDKLAATDDLTAMQPDTDAAHRTAREIFFEAERRFAKDLSCNPHAFLVACIMSSRFQVCPGW